MKPLAGNALGRAILYAIPPGIALSYCILSGSNNSSPQNNIPVQPKNEQRVTAPTAWKSGIDEAVFKSKQTVADTSAKIAKEAADTATKLVKKGVRK